MPAENTHFLSLFYQPGEKVYFQRGDRDCYERTEWKVKLGKNKGETFFVPLSGRKCFQGSNLNEVASCESDYFQCQESKEIVNFQNNYSTCAIVSDKMILERYVSTRIASNGFSFCQPGQHESLEMRLGGLQELEPIEKPVASKLVIIDPLDSTVGVATDIVVQAQTTSGLRVDDYEGSVTLSTTGSATGGGVVNLTQGEGRITIQDQLAETILLSLTDSAGTGLDVSSTQDIIFQAGEPQSLVFRVQPVNSDSYRIMNPGLEVVLRDSFGNTVSHSSETVVVSLSQDPSGGVANVSGTLSRGANNGVAIFDDLSFDYPASGYQFQASLSGGISAVSDSFDILPTGVIEVSSLSETFI